MDEVKEDVSIPLVLKIHKVCALMLNKNHPGESLEKISPYRLVGKSHKSQIFPMTEKIASMCLQN